METDVMSAPVCGGFFVRLQTHSLSFITLNIIKVHITCLDHLAQKIKCFLEDQRSINPQMERDVLFGYLFSGEGSQASVACYLEM